MKFMTIKIASRQELKYLAQMLIITAALLLTGCVTTNSDGSTTTEVETPDSKKVDIYAELARGYINQKQYEVAERELRKALNIVPDHSASNYMMGLLMIETEQYERVESFMNRAVDSDASNSSAAHDFGVFLCQRGQELRSITYFDKAAANPYFERPELSLMRAGECLYKIGDPARAEIYLTKSLKLNSRMQPALFNLAKIKYQTESYLSARAYIERYFAITKPQAASLLLAYQIESKLNAREVAEKYRVMLLENFPGSREARGLRSRLN